MSRKHGLRALLLCGVAFACDSTEESSDAGSFGQQCMRSDQQRMECVAPGQTVQGSELPATFDEHGCQVRAEVRNSCCRPAVAGPRLIEGECCYVFCEDVCC